MNWVLLRIGPPFAALHGVVGNRGLRRAELAFLAFSAAEAATWVAILVYAYDRGGTAETGLVGLLLLVPAGIVAPVAAALGDRYRRERVLLIGYAAQTVAVIATAVAMLTDLSAVVVYGLAIVAMASMTTARPGHHSLIPNLARTPDEMTAGNSVSSLAEGLGATLGTAAAAGLLVVWDAGIVYAVMGGVLAVATVLMIGVRSERVRAPQDRLRPWTLALETFEGLATIARSSGPRLLVAIAALLTITWGAFDVLLVTIGIEVLGIGEGGVGALQTAAGVGTLLGAAGSVALVGRRSLLPAVLVAALVLGGTVAATGFAQSTTVALVSVVGAGVGLALLDVTGRTLLQRVVDDAVLTRMFGAIEALWMAGVGIGAALAAAMVGPLGLDWTLAIFGATVPLFSLLAFRGLRRVDRAAVVPERQLALLGAIEMFAPLPRTDLERVARQLDLLPVRAGDVVIQEGEVGDRFYVIDAGTFEVEAGARPIAQLHEGDHFGEIALLEDVPRTATVRARTDGAVWALDQEEFLTTITGLPQAATAAHAVSAERRRAGSDRHR
ncbi:MAG: MFS transporter [Actinomycetota bacterium]